MKIERYRVPMWTLLYLSVAPIALAQEAPSKNSDQIEQFTVTAEKRAENLKEVPASIAFTSQVQLEDE